MEQSTTSANRPAAGPWWPRDRRAIAFAIFAAVLSLAFVMPLVALTRHALHEELHSHIVLIPLVALYLANLQRAELLGERMKSLGIAGIFALLAAAVFVIPRLAGWSSGWSLNDRLSLATASYVLFLVAGGFATLGKNWMGQLAFPFAFLIFMIPMPDALVEGLEQVLMRLSADLAEKLFQLTGTPVFRRGQVLELPGMTLQVARECSGIRSTVVLFITSLLASYMFLKSATHRAWLVALVIPLGILRNAFRVLVLGLLCVHINPEMIDSWIHHRGGPVFFAISLVPLFLAAAWFRHRERRGEIAEIPDETGIPEFQN